VIGGDVVVHQKGGKFRSASLRLLQRAALAHARASRPTRPMVEAGAKFGGQIDAISSQGLVVYALNRQPVLRLRDPRARRVADAGRADMRYFVSASNGQVLDGWNTIQTSGRGRHRQDLLVGNVSLNTSTGTGGYQLVDSTRGGGNTRNGLGKVIDNVYNSAAIMTDADNIWGNNTTSDVASEASDAHYGVQQTWDFYKNTFGRNGIYNDNVGVKSIVHVTFRSQGPATGGNAAWYGAPYKFMAYGLGTTSWYPVVAIDVAGHEMTHGVTEATAGLTYSNDAGGLNEASSDIMGTMVEYYTNNAADTPDYMIGEKIYKSNPTGTRRCATCSCRAPPTATAPTTATRRVA
jgi:Zn-dependent metalloprotease